MKIKSDEFYERLIVSIKEEKKFKCQHCNPLEEGYYLTKAMGRKCKNCKCVESKTANTAFHSLKLKIVDVVKILAKLQNDYNRKKKKYQNDVDFLIGDKKFPKNSRPRLNNSVLAKQMELEVETIWHLYNRISKWMPKEYSERGAGDYWLPGNNFNRKMYHSLYNLLFTENDKPRKTEQIFRMLIFKRFSHKI